MSLSRGVRASGSPSPTLGAERLGVQACSATGCGAGTGRFTGQDLGVHPCNGPHSAVAFCSRAARERKGAGEGRQDAVLRAPIPASWMRWVTWQALPRPKQQKVWAEPHPSAQAQRHLLFHSCKPFPKNSFPSPPPHLCPPHTC